MCLIKIHKIVAGKTRELFHLSQSIRVCVLPGKSGLCRKNFPNGFHMPLSPKWGLPRERGLGQGAGTESPPPRRSASAHTLHRLPLFKQKTSWPMIYGRFQRLFHPGEIAPGASSSQVGHGELLRSELADPPQGPDPQAPLVLSIYCQSLRGGSRP